MHFDYHESNKYGNAEPMVLFKAHFPDTLAAAVEMTPYLQ